MDRRNPGLPNSNRFFHHTVHKNRCSNLCSVIVLDHQWLLSQQKNELRCFQNNSIVLVCLRNNRQTTILLCDARQSEQIQKNVFGRQTFLR